MNIFEILKIPAVYAQGADESTSFVEEKVTGFFDFFISNLPNWILAVIVAFLSVILAKFFKKVVENKMTLHIGGETEQQGAILLASRTTFWGIMILGITFALSIAGLHVETLVAAVGLGISFALKDLFTNFVAGVMILLSKQFSIGDMINVDGTIGKVEEIQARATILKALDGTKVIMPNTKLFTKKVTSLTSNPIRRIEVKVGVSFISDLNKAATTVLKVLSGHPDILKKPSPAVLLSSFSEQSMDFKVRFWVSSHSAWLKTKSDVIALIKQSFDLEGIEIPYPTRDVNIKNKENEKVVLNEVKAPPIVEENSQAPADTSQSEIINSENTAGSSTTTNTPENNPVSSADTESPNSQNTNQDSSPIIKHPDASLPGADFMAQA